MHEHKLNFQSEASRTFEKKRHVNKINEQAETSPNNNAIKFKPQKELPLRNLQTLQYRQPKKWTEIIFTGERQLKSWK